MSETARTILATTRRDSLRFACLFLFGTTFLSCYHYVVAAFGDPRDYYTLSETGGPFEVSIDAAGHITRGQDDGSYAPGQRIGWLSSLCSAQGVSYTGHVSMVRLAQDGVPEKVIVARDTHYEPSDHRCGPKIYALAIPEDALAGNYELRRSLDFREGTPWPLHARTPSIPFRVTAQTKDTSTNP